MRRFSLFRIILQLPQFMQKYAITEVLSKVSAPFPNKKLPAIERTFDFPKVLTTSSYRFSPQTEHPRKTPPLLSL